MHTYSKLLFSSVFALAALLWGIPEAWAGTCGCTVGSANGSGNLQVQECTIHRVIAYDGCSTIKIADTLSGKKGTAAAPVDIILNVGIPLNKIALEGPALDSGKPVVRLVYGSATSSMLVDMTGGASLKNIAISAPGKTAIKVSGAGSTISDVVVDGSMTGVELQAGSSGTKISNSNFSNNQTAIVMHGSGHSLDGNSFVNQAKFAIQLDTDTIDTHFLTNTFTGNKTAIVVGGGNQNTTPPWLVRSFQDSNGVITLLVAAKTNATVKVFRADAAFSPQGAEVLAEAKPASALTSLKGITPYSNDDVYNSYYLVSLNGIAKDTQIVLLSDLPSVGTSFFSPKFKPSDALDIAPSSCLDKEWFLNSAIIVTWESKDGGVWDYDFDGDGFKNGDEDKDKNCQINGDKAANESNPADKTDTPFVFTYVNLCLINKIYCNFPLFPIDPNKPAIIQDADQDDVADEKDKCPMVAKDDQNADADADGLGNVCDPDADNDGLSNLYCDPNVPFSKSDFDGGKTCTLVGVDQEGAVNKVKDPDPDSVDLHWLNADSDGDGYCDGSGFGPIVDGKPKCQPSDNCPRLQNAYLVNGVLTGQWDTDEDGIGNNCDISKKDAYTPNPDSDGDGIKDWLENGKGDNCPWIANPYDVDTNGDGVLDTQRDTDGDGRGDACDSDDDNDGVLDVVENSTRYSIFDKASGKLLTTVMLNPLSAESDVDIAVIADAQNQLKVDKITPAPDTFCDGNGPGPQKPDGSYTCTKALRDKCPVLIGEDCNANTANWKIVSNANPNDATCFVKYLGATAQQLGYKKPGGPSVDIACDDDIDGEDVKNWEEDARKDSNGYIYTTHFWEWDSDHYKWDSLNMKEVGADGLSDNSNVPGGDICPANYSPGNVDICHKPVGKKEDTDQDGICDGAQAVPGVCKAGPDNCIDKYNPDQSNMDKDKEKEKGQKEVGDACDEDIDGDGSYNEIDKCPKDPKDTCIAGPGVNQPPPGPLSGPTTQAFQGGGGCSLVTNTTGTATAAPIAVMMLAALMGLRLRRSM